MKWFNESKYIDLDTNQEIKPLEKIYYTIIKTEKKTHIDEILQIGRITFIYHCKKLQLTLNLL